MSIKVGCKHHDMRIAGRIVGVHSTEQSVGIKSGAFDPDIILTLNHNPLTMVNLMLTHLSID